MSGKERDEDVDEDEESQSDEHGQGEQAGRDGSKKERSGAEWVTLTISILIVLALIGLVSYQYFTRGTDPPVITLEPRMSEARQEGESYYLPIDITNEGELTAEDIEIQLSLETGEGEPETIAFTIKFLAGGETGSETVVFQQDPSQGTLNQNISFSVP